jgi:hypothetical protein
LNDEEVRLVRQRIDALEHDLRRDHTNVDAHAKRHEAMRSMLESDKAKVADHVSGKIKLDEDELKRLHKKIRMLEERIVHENADLERRQRRSRPDLGIEL